MMYIFCVFMLSGLFAFLLEHYLHNFNTRLKQVIFLNYLSCILVMLNASLCIISDIAAVCIFNFIQAVLIIMMAQK